MVFFVQLLFYTCMSNQELLMSSMNGDYSSVQRLLNNYNIDTNIKDILNITILMVFKNIF